MEHKRREQREAAQWIIWSSCRNAAIWGAKENNDPQRILEAAYPLDGVEQKEKKALPKGPPIQDNLKGLKSMLAHLESKGVAEPKLKYIEDGIEYEIIIEDRIKELENGADIR